VYAERELVDVGALAAEVEDSDFGVRYTAVEARLGVRLGKRQSQSCHAMFSTWLERIQKTQRWRVEGIAWMSPSPSNCQIYLRGPTHLVLAIPVTSCRTTGHGIFFRIS